jgi:hypothetical protein
MVSIRDFIAKWQLTVLEFDTASMLEFSGNFELDYRDACLKMEVAPLNVLKFTALPQLPPKTSAPEATKTESRYKFTPTIYIEAVNDNDDDEENMEMLKISLRGYTLQLKALQVILAIAPSALNLTTLNFWNCGLTEQHFTLINNTIVSSSVRFLYIDQNPLIPETAFHLLLLEESNLKALSLRGNKISDPGARLIGSALKNNRVLTNLSLFDNNITKEGAGCLSEGLKSNFTLQLLNLGSNFIGDEGLATLASALSNIALTPDEVQLRKKQQVDQDKQKHELEDDNNPKKKSSKRAGSGKKEEKEDKKKKAPIAAKKPDVAKAKAPEEPKNKVDDKKLKDKKAPAAKGKKGKAEEAKEEIEDSNDVPECMFEMNGQVYLFGNRSLNSLNVINNGISNLGAKTLLNAVLEQDNIPENASELLGLYRVAILV